MTVHERLVLAPYAERPLPLFIESIGMHGEQETIDRDQGYPFYHWIQTIEGEGEIAFAGKTFVMTPHTGVLLLPHAAHFYRMKGTTWSTSYVTFGGALASELLALLGLAQSAFYRWEARMPLGTEVVRMFRRIKETPDISGLADSADMYRFLTLLKQYGETNSRNSMSSNAEQLQPLLDWLDARFGDPDVGLREMAAVLHVSTRHLGALFRDTFGLPPYAYLILLRIRKAKELLLADPAVPVMTIATRAGFRDASHFVATFRTHVGLTPERFRTLH